MQPQQLHLQEELAISLLNHWRYHMLVKSYEEWKPSKEPEATLPQSLASQLLMLMKSHPNILDYPQLPAHKN